MTEGSAGSTAISLATVAPAYGCKCHVVIPDDVAIEKVCALNVCLISHKVAYQYLLSLVTSALKQSLLCLSASSYMKACNVKHVCFSCKASELSVLSV